MGKKTTSKKVRIATEKYAPEQRASVTSRSSPSSNQALNNLIDGIGKDTENLSFKEMMEVKVALRMMSHISKKSLEDMASFKSVLEELCMFWKINRLDLDLLEHLLMKAGLHGRFDLMLNEYKKLVDYEKLTASSERDVTTIVSTLHNSLQGSDDATGSYTTVSFLHYGDVYNFDRSRLKCVKTDLSKLLDIQPYQITYLAKVSSGIEGYVTLMQMPVSITRRFLEQARMNHPTLMSMGIKGMQITGSDGLRYTQSMGYLQEKIPVHTQTKEIDFRMANRSAKTAPAGPSLPPLSRKTRAVASQNSYHNTLSRDQGFRSTKIDTIREVEREETKELLKQNISKLYEKAMDANLDPTEAKFERRVRLARDTLSQLTQEDQDGLVKVLLDQIQKLQRMVANLKRDLRDKTRDLNSSQHYVQRAQKELKSMEMKVETKAQEISKTNDHLLKRVKKLMNENTLLRETIESQEVELEVYRQSDRENTFRGLMRVRRVGRGKQPATARSTLATFA